MLKRATNRSKLSVSCSEPDGFIIRNRRRPYPRWTLDIVDSFPASPSNCLTGVDKTQIIGFLCLPKGLKRHYSQPLGTF